MKKIKLGIYGPSGRMGQDILKQLKSFNDFDLVSLCEKENHANINKEINKMILCLIFNLQILIIIFLIGNRYFVYFFLIHFYFFKISF